MRSLSVLGGVQLEAVHFLVSEVFSQIYLVILFSLKLKFLYFSDFTVFIEQLLKSLLLF